MAVECLQLFDPVWSVKFLPGFCGSVGMTLGTRRFQRAVSAEDLLIGINRPCARGDAYQVWFL
jgi:hypothetical protein